MRGLFLAMAILPVGCSSSGDDDSCPTQGLEDVPSGAGVAALPVSAGMAVALPAAIRGATIWQAGSCYYVMTTGTIDKGRIMAYEQDSGMLLRLSSDVPPDVPVALSFPEVPCSGSFVIHATDMLVESRGFNCPP